MNGYWLPRLVLELARRRRRDAPLKSPTALLLRLHPDRVLALFAHGLLCLTDSQYDPATSFRTIRASALPAIVVPRKHSRPLIQAVERQHRVGRSLASS